LDYETYATYDVTIQASVTTNGVYKAKTGTFTILVINQNDLPVFSSNNPLVLSLNADQAIGATFAELAATDEDYPAGNTTPLTFSIEGGDGTFGISSTVTGTTHYGGLNVLNSSQLAALPQGVQESYALTIGVVDQTNVVVSTPFNLTITGVNDAPVFAMPPAFIELSELAANNNVVTMLSANDVDANAILSYAHISPLSAAITETFFVDTSSAGISIRVKDASRLDYDTLPNEYTIDVQVTDAFGASDIATLLIRLTDENDEPTVLASTQYTTTVTENSTASLAQIAATDADIGKQLTYTVAAVQPASQAGLFTIDAATGILSTSGLDYEQGGVVTVTVRVQDRSGLPVTAAVIVTVTNVLNEPPTINQIIPSNNVAILETMALTGTTVFTITATDPEGVAPLTYTIVDGDGDANFVASNTDGRFVLAAALDADVPPISYTLEIRVSDGVTHTVATVIVTVLEVNDSLPRVVLNSAEIITLPETTPIGTPLITLTGTDNDSSSLIYTISHTTRRRVQLFPNTLIANTGQTINISTTYPLDAETATSHSVQIVASDGDLSADPIWVQLNVSDVDDNPTLFAEAATTWTFPENTRPATQVIATDQDVGAVLTYGLLAVDPPSNAFALDPNSGILSVTTALDFGAQPVTTLTVGVSDRGNPSIVTKTIIARLQNTNDTLLRLENTPFGEVVVDVQAVSLEGRPLSPRRITHGRLAPQQRQTDDLITILVDEVQVTEGISQADIGLRFRTIDTQGNTRQLDDLPYPTIHLTQNRFAFAFDTDIRPITPHAIILIDSTHPDFASMQRAASEIVMMAAPDVHFAVLTYAQTVTLQQAFTNDRKALLNAIRNAQPQPDALPCPHDSLESSITSLARFPVHAAQQTIFMLQTDVWPLDDLRCQQVSPLPSVTLAQSANIRLIMFPFQINAQIPIDVTTETLLASRTGGSVWKYKDVGIEQLAPQLLSFVSYWELDASVLLPRGRSTLLLESTYCAPACQQIRGVFSAESRTHYLPLQAAVEAVRIEQVEKSAEVDLRILC
ncbi:MAG: cadherin domain-containing protein, partial [Candidatus Promineifilaceae bacterium]